MHPPQHSWKAKSELLEMRNRILLEDLTTDIIAVQQSIFRISAGELAAYNTKKILDVTAALSELVTRSELRDVTQTIIGQHQSDSEGA